MTGPEHFREAESDRDAAARASDRGQEEDAMFWLGSAQVHATLALAAATALPGQHSGDWEDAILAFGPEPTVEEERAAARESAWIAKVTR